VAIPAKFYGGAMAPTSFSGFLSVSWPLAVMTFEEELVSISFRAPWIRKVANALALGKAPKIGESGVEWWSEPASEISETLIGRRSVIAKTRRGDVRFVLISSTKMKDLESEFHRLGIRDVKVRSTIPSMFSMSGVRRARRNNQTSRE
jgi:hypothetical protein